MRVKTILLERYQDYIKPSMYIASVSCSGKCCLEAGIPTSVCINDGWRNSATLTVEADEICQKYLSNPITQAIVFGGLEPLDQTDEVIEIVDTLRNKYECDDDIVIYTGYYPYEIMKTVEALQQYKNIVVKFGRYIPEMKPKFDHILGVTLASENQFAERIS